LTLLHLGIALALRLASFEATMIASFALFLTAEDWLAIRHLREHVGSRVRPDRSLESPTVAEPPESGTGFRPGATRRAWAADLAASFLLLLIVVDGYNRNLASRPGGPPRIRRPHIIRAILEVPQLIQDWHMFAPNPYERSGYWMARAVLADGSEVDPLTGGDPPGWASRNGRFWYKYLERLAQPRYEALRPWLATYLLERHNRASSPTKRISAISLLYVPLLSPPPGADEANALARVCLWPTAAR